HAVTALSQRQAARNVAMLVQEPQMPAGMTVSQYVLLGRVPHLGYLGRESSRDRRIVRDIVRRLALEDMTSRPLDRLSGGERQRAAIARALAQQAPVLLIDEPTSSLDVGRQQSVLELIDQLRREQELTVIAAMHELTLAGQYADRLALLVAGRLVAVGAALRAVGRGWKVCVIQFVKSNRWKVGEQETATRLGVEWWTIGDGFTWDSRDMKRTEAIAREAWRIARERIQSADYRLVV